jgi:hypothetical protein
MGFYLTTLTGIGFTLKAVWKSYNVGKAAEAIERKLEEDVGVFTHRAGFSNEKQILWAMKSRHRFIATAAGLSLGMVGLFASFVQFKNRNRFK